MATVTLPWARMSEQPPEDLDWSPLVPGGAAFRTHRLVERTATRIELHPSAQARTLIGVVASLGVVALGFVVWGIVVNDPPAMVTAGVFVVTTGVLALLLRRQLDNCRFFDAQLGCYWRSRGAGDPPGSDAVPLSSIRGLQITPERIVNSESDYDAYELNLVLAEGRRVNVLDHGNLPELHADATRIAGFLRVPLWIEPGVERLAAIQPRT